MKKCRKLRLRRTFRSDRNTGFRDKTGKGCLVKAWGLWTVGLGHRDSPGCGISGRVFGLWVQVIAQGCGLLGLASWGL